MNMPVPNNVLKQKVSVQALMAQHGKTFWWASQLFSENTRADTATLYAYVRVIDDLVDDLLKTQPYDDKNSAEQALTKATKNTLGFDAVQALFIKYDISPNLMSVFIREQIEDVLPARVDDEKALFTYCYGVAGVIGQMMRPILQADKAATPHAVALGLAMQMTNIARDVVEDALAGRVYLPKCYLSKKLIYQDIADPAEANKTVIFDAINRLLHLADQYYAFAKEGYPMIPLRNRLTVHVAAKLYQAIGHEIISSGSARYWQGRISINIWQKTYLSAAAVFETFFYLLKHKQISPEVYIKSVGKMAANNTHQSKIDHSSAQHIMISQQVNTLIENANIG